MKREKTFTLDHWSEKNYQSLVKFLKEHAEEPYRQFQEKLVASKEPVLGVRMPFLRSLGKQISQGNFREYLSLCRENSFEEIVLRGMVIGLLPLGLEELCSATEAYLPVINNWASCDCFCSGLKRVKKFQKEFLPKIQSYLVSEHPWEKRVGLVLLRAHYVTEEYITQIPVWAEQTFCEHYYVQMAHAWLLAECYTKFPEQTYQYLKACSLHEEIMKKTVQKIRDSYRISAEWKEKASALRKRNNGKTLLCE